MVEQVWYPLLNSHPDVKVARRLLPQGAGGVLSFTIKGSYEDLLFFQDRLTRFGISASFGGARSLIQPTKLVSYSQCGPAELEAIGIKPTLTRLSVGVNKPLLRLIADLDSAFEALRSEQQRVRKSAAVTPGQGAA